MPEQKCPLCEEIAEYKYAAYGKDPKRFTCPNCLLFVIPHATEKLLKNMPKENLLELSSKSKNIAIGNVLYIYHEEKDNESTIKTRSDPEENWS